MKIINLNEEIVNILIEEKGLGENKFDEVLDLLVKYQYSDNIIGICSKTYISKESLYQLYTELINL